MFHNGKLCGNRRSYFLPSERVREDERERERMNKRDMLIMLEEERDTERFWPFGEKREGETDR